MTFRNQATRIALSDFRSIPMRAFHMSWMAFFVCFFGWFGIAPLMPVVREQLHLTKAQVGNTMIASVAITIFARMLLGWLCDRIGPRKAYAWLLLLGSIPVITIGLATGYTSFLIFRLAIGAIGASFVITQYHTSVMFAPNVVGAANATTAGWGNLGGGVTQIVMPLLLSALLSLGVSPWWGWRLAMVFPGAALLITGITYLRLTCDTPNGNLDELPAEAHPAQRASASLVFRQACRDRRVWILCLCYAACFGVELTVDNLAALYFVDKFQLTLRAAGVVAGLFGMMNLFARALGGIVSDRFGARWGLRGRSALLASTLLAEGLALITFSQMHWLSLSVAAMMLTGLFVKMSNGATYAIVPFVNRRGIGAVSGIVGAGGNGGAVLFGFLFRTPQLTWSQSLFIVGIAVLAIAALAAFLRFDEEDSSLRQNEARQAKEFEAVPIAAAATE